MCAASGGEGGRKKRSRDGATRPACFRGFLRCCWQTYFFSFPSDPPPSFLSLHLPFGAFCAPPPPPFFIFLPFRTLTLPALPISSRPRHRIARGGGKKEEKRTVAKCEIGARPNRKIVFSLKWKRRAYRVSIHPSAYFDRPWPMEDFTVRKRVRGRMRVRIYPLLAFLDANRREIENEGYSREIEKNVRKSRVE